MVQWVIIKNSVNEKYMHQFKPNTINHKKPAQIAQGRVETWSNLDRPTISVAAAFM